jgi:hypothetical protein
MLELANTSMGFLTNLFGSGLLELAVGLMFDFCVGKPPLNGFDGLVGS